MQNRFWNLVWLGYLILQHLWCCQHLSWNWEQKTSLHWRLDRGHKLHELLRTDVYVYTTYLIFWIFFTRICEEIPLVDSTPFGHRILFPMNLWNDCFGEFRTKSCENVLLEHVQKATAATAVCLNMYRKLQLLQQFSNWTEGGTARKRRNMRSQCCIPGKLWPPQTCPISNVKCQSTLWSAFSCASAWSISFLDTMVWSYS